MSGDAAALVVRSDEVTSLRRRLIVAEAEQEDQRLRTRSIAHFIQLVALVVVIGVGLAGIAAALGVDTSAIVRIGTPVTLGVAVVSAIVLAIAVRLQLREAEQRRVDNRRLLELETKIASAPSGE